MKTVVCLLWLLLVAALGIEACTPKKGPELDKPSDGKTPANEPCYIHDETVCEGYQVCCVTTGTCKEQGGTVSSNEDYYEGGCYSPESSKGDLAPGCEQVGECHKPYLEHTMGGIAKKG